MIAAALGIFATICWGALTDRIGRRPVYLLGTAIIVRLGHPAVPAWSTPARRSLIVLAFVVSYAVCQNSLAGVQGAWFSELFAAKTRTTGASLAYQLSAVVSGFTPLRRHRALRRLRLDRPGPAVQRLRRCWASLAALVTRETWGRPSATRSRLCERELERGRPPSGPAAESDRQRRRPGRRDRPAPPYEGAHDDIARHLAGHRPAGTDQAERIERLRAGRLPDPAQRPDMGEVQGQGYIGQALGVADVLAVVYTDQLRHRPEDPHWPGRDRFLLSIGHYAIALYAALAEAGIIPVEELETYGSDDSRLPMSGMASYTPGMEISGGSLGHGLGVATGMALGLRHQGNPARVFNLLSDGELDEGSTWEAALACAHHGLDNVTAIVDVNALQADGPTAGVLRTEPVTEKWQAFGWHALRVDGNDIAALVAALRRAARAPRLARRC